MQKQKLPNATAVLILGILSVPTCCCYGIGLILAIIALVLAKKDTALYMQHPELYDGYPNLNTGRVFAIIGVVLSAVYIMTVIYMKINYTDEELKGIQDNFIEKMQAAQQEE